MKRTLSNRQKAVLEVMSKPKIPSELREQMSLKSNYNIRSTIAQLIRLNLVYCLNQKARTGKLYGLTNNGIRLRNKLSNKAVVKYKEPNINWALYGWIVAGKQKRAILKGIKQPFPLKYVKENAQFSNPRISRMNCHDILQLFVKKGIAKRAKENGRIIYSPTNMGERIRDQLLS